MAGNKKKDLGYLPAVAAAAPVFGLKAVVGDLPKGALEYAVENKALGGNRAFGTYLRQGFKGRGAGRALGAGLGILSAPFFVKGTRLLESKNKDDKRRGLALVAGSTAGLAAAKGFLEAGVEGISSGMNPIAAATSGGMRAGIRAGYKIPLALATTFGVAAGRSKSDSSPAMKYLAPVAAGAGVGAISRSIEEAAQIAAKGKGLRLTPANLRKITAAGLGGAAGGVLGGLVLAKAVDVLSPKEKKAAVPVGAALDALLSMGGSAAAHAGKEIGLGYAGPGLLQHTVTGAGYGYKAQSGFLKKLLGEKAVASLQKSTNRARSRQVGLGIQEGLYGYGTAPMGAKFLSNFGVGIGGVSPESMAYRELGIKLGRSLREKAPGEREAFLKKMQKFIIDRPDTLKGAEGELNPLTAPLLGGISMAVGERPFYVKGGKLKEVGKWALHGGHPYSEKGLPTALGALEKEPGWLKQNYPHLMAMTGLAASGPGVLGTAAGMAGGHGALSGIKNMVTTLPFVKEKIVKSTHQGIRYGVFPGKAFKPTLGMEIGLSPATTMMERSLKPLVTAIRDEEIARGVGAIKRTIASGKDTSRAKRIIKDTPKALLLPLGAGAGVGLAGNAILSRKKQGEP
jgi:hypothetical protein